MHPVVVLMGVSGSGKTVVGREVSRLTGAPFVDGDDFHASGAVAKMRAGTPLDDSDRAPWLARIRAWIDAQVESGNGGVVACSALTRSARATLRRDGVALVLLAVDPAVLAARVGERHHAYMPASLLPSQLATFEDPGHEEGVLRVRSEGSVEETARRVVTLLDS
ncbi:MAG: carbohydrate kinase, thermoresistant glucokinase family [Labilithrix sp.]|nr:carbohydrate kinase, thermoresistant glucokinase family [Labilithrix sp.]